MSNTEPVNTFEKNMRLVACFGQIALWWFLCVPSSIIFYRNFLVLCGGNSIMAKKRYPAILRIQGLVIIVFFLVGMPFLTVDFSFIHHVSAETRLILTRCAILHPAFTLAIFYLQVWRFWHIFYDLKHSSSQKNSEWKFHLDPSTVEDNWWLNHYKTFGNVKYTKNIVLVMYSVSTILVLVNYQIWAATEWHSVIGHGLSVVLHQIPCGGGIIIWFLIPNYNDSFFIKDEVRYITFAITFAVTCLLAALVYGYFVSLVGALWLGLLCAGVIFMATMYVSFHWAPKKIRQREMQIWMAKHHKDGEIEVSTTVSTGEAIQGVLTNIVQKLRRQDSAMLTAPEKKKSSSNRSLHVFLSHERTFKIFMQHLAREFSMELLLCFVEILQFKFEFKQHFNAVNPSAIDGSDAVDFAEAAPLSEIVPESIVVQSALKESDTKDEKGLIKCGKRIALQLYRKYVAIGSELETNISGVAKDRYASLMHNEKKWYEHEISATDLYTFYDDVATEMFKLMIGAFARFQITPEYKQAMEMVDV